MAIIQKDAYGSSYADDLQLEYGDVPSSVNLLQNGDFTYASSGEWSGSQLYIDPNYDASVKRDHYSYIWGHNSMGRGSQTVPINGSSANTYLLSGWGFANSAANTEPKLTDSTAESSTSRYFGLIARCDYTDGTKEYFYMPFNDDYNGWQYASCVIAPKDNNKTIEDITVIPAYDYNINWAAFDDISLTQEPCTTYAYDSQGNITAVNATGNSRSTFTYASGTTKLTQSNTQANGTYKYTYGDSNNDHLVTKIQNDGVTMNITYDAKGNSTATSLSADSNSALGSIKTSATYSTDGSQLLTQTNSSGYQTIYTYDAWRNLATVKDNAGNLVNQTYYYSNDRPHMTYMTGKVSVENTYTNGNLTNVDRAGFIPNDSTKYYQNYVMEYDAFGNMTSFKVGNKLSGHLYL